MLPETYIFFVSGAFFPLKFKRDKRVIGDRWIMGRNDEQRHLDEATLKADKVTVYILTTVLFAE